MVKQQLPKLRSRVRFPSFAPYAKPLPTGRGFTYYKRFKGIERRVKKLFHVYFFEDILTRRSPKRSQAAQPPLERRGALSECRALDVT